VEGVKVGILLEVGFDDVTPNNPLTISSWAYDRAAATSLKINDNRAVDIKCYDPGYTFVEKLQTVVTKFRLEQESGIIRQNFLRQYYDLYELLGQGTVVNFIGSEEYHAHKQRRFNTKDKAIPINENQAFLFSDPKLFDQFNKRYQETAALYHKRQPPFEDVLGRIKKYKEYRRSH
jgi:hypothetical protein